MPHKGRDFRMRWCRLNQAVPEVLRRQHQLANRQATADRISTGNGSQRMCHQRLDSVARLQQAGHGVLDGACPCFYREAAGALASIRMNATFTGLPERFAQAWAVPR